MASVIVPFSEPTYILDTEVNWVKIREVVGRDMSIFDVNTSTPSDSLDCVFDLAVTSGGIPTSSDVFIKNITIAAGAFNTGVNKVILRENQSLYIKKTAGSHLNVTVSGAEETTAAVLKSETGLTTPRSCTSTGTYSVVNPTALAKYSMVNMYIYNTSTTNTATGTVHVSVQPEDTVSGVGDVNDLLYRYSIDPGETISLNGIVVPYGKKILIDPADETVVATASCMTLVA